MARILTVDDDPGVRRLIGALLEAEGFEVRTTASGEEFRRAFDASLPDLVMVDLHLPDATGLDLLRYVAGRAPSIVVTASDSARDAVEAIRLGASDYVVKPVEAQRVQVSVRNALRLAHQQGEIARLRAEVEEANGPEHLVGRSAKMEALRSLVRQVAAGDVPVLVTGETGTGKELVARALHYAGPRRTGPFVDVNCAAFTESLMESDMFGHERGAFTGAQSTRAGMFEQADGGTLFLDEIGDMPMALQAKILRVLQEGRFRRVGGEQAVSVDVRVVCATHRNLADEVKAGRFRQDLFYRIHAVGIAVPPLRERLEDVAELAEHFLRRSCRRQKRPMPALTPEALERLRCHSWPGNVRELEHAIERAVLLCEGDRIEPSHLPAELSGGAPAAGPAEQGLLQAVERLERAMILEALEKSGGVKARAARALGITERILSYKVASLGIGR